MTLPETRVRVTDTDTKDCSQNRLNMTGLDSGMPPTRVQLTLLNIPPAVISHRLVANNFCVYSTPRSPNKNCGNSKYIILEQKQ